MEAKYIVLFILINIQTIQAADVSDQRSKMGNLETTSIIKNPKELGDRVLDLKNNNEFCDAEIVVGNKTIPVHKNILASSSAYFKTVFSDKESKSQIIIKNVDIEIVQSLINYCYTGIISVSEKNLREIMLLATSLKMTPIIEGCAKIIEKIMDSSNCIWTWRLDKSEHYENLRKIAFEYIRQNYETLLTIEVSQSSEFLDLNYSEILEILKSDIAVTNETIVFESVKNWINHHSTSRIQHLDGLSDYIKFENLPKNILIFESLHLCSVNSSYKCHEKCLIALQPMKKNNFECADNDLINCNSTLMAVNSFFPWKSKTFEIFDLRNQKWIKIENFYCDRTEYSAVLLEDKLMLIGGLNNDGITFNTVQSYDLNTGAMENFPPMKYARHSLSAVEFEGRVYAIGGFDNTYLSYVEMWDPVLKIWKTLTSMSIKRDGCGVGILDGEILIVGGYNFDRKFISDVESYNPVTDKWRKRASMNVKRSDHGVAVVGGYLYAVGGYTTDYVYLNTAERYDPKIDKWTMIHSLNEAKAIMGTANLFGKLVIVGGHSNNSQALSTMEMYDDEKNKWISMPPLNDPRLGLNAIKIPWQLAKVTLSREVPK